jgi:predicted RNase H-related nuclease YkuK (DUF458 family)
MFSEHQKQEIVDYLIENDGTVYIGGDSVKFVKTVKGQKQSFAKYTVVFVVHINNKNGARIFHYSDVEPVYDKKLNKPRMRLMREVQKVVECYLEFGELLDDREVEIHLDINSDANHGSNVVAREAIGYVTGTTGRVVKIKPEAFAAAHAGDHYVRGKQNR